MEIKGGKRTNGHSCGLYCPCGKMTVGHMMVKIFMALAIIGFGLVVAMTVFYAMDRGMIKKPCLGKVRGEAVQQRFETGKVMMGGGNVFFKEAPEMAIPERVFGNITKIEANRITIMNNGAQEQLVVSEADTVIISSSTEVGLSALKTGQDIVVLGTPNKDNVLTAKVINIQ